MHFVLKDSSEWMNYTYTLWLGPIHFPKTFKPFQKPRCQKIDILEVHNLNIRHCLVLQRTRFENILSMATTSPTCTSDVHRWGHLKGTISICFECCTYCNPDCFYGNKHDTKCVKIWCIISKV